MNNIELSKKFNLSVSYFYVMKKLNAEKYEFVFGFDNNRLQSINKYIQYVETIKQQVNNIISKFDTNELNKWLVSNGIYNYGYSADSLFMMLYSERKTLLNHQLSDIRKFEKIVRINNGS